MGAQLILGGLQKMGSYILKVWWKWEFGMEIWGDIG